MAAVKMKMDFIQPSRFLPLPLLILHTKPSILQHDPSIPTQQHNAMLSSLLKWSYGFACAYQTPHWVCITYNTNSTDRF